MLVIIAQAPTFYASLSQRRKSTVSQNTQMYVYYAYAVEFKRKYVRTKISQTFTSQ